MSADPFLLLWRGEKELTTAGTLALPLSACRYCSAPLDRVESKYSSKPVGKKCRLCGWGFTWIDEIISGAKQYRASEVILRGFKVGSDKVALHELGSHLRRRFSDIHNISPVRFEHLIGDIFKNLGYSVEMTKQSRDGGVDLYLLTNTGHRIAVVQCKRHSVENKVGVSLVSELLGTQLSFGTRRGILVTTSTFTQPAIDRSQSWPMRQLGFEVDLVDAYDILNLLQVYNTELPPLNDLSGDFLANRGIVMQP